MKIGAKVWIKVFMESLKALENKNCWGKGDVEWTICMGKVLERVGKEIECDVTMRRNITKKDAYSGEYLNIDAMFTDNQEDWNEEDWNPLVLPSVVVELENDYGGKQITYCLWKILCIRAEIRVLICYQDATNKINCLKTRLEEVITERELMKGEDSELLVIIGDDSKNEYSEWNEYFKVFEWRNGRLETHI